MTTRTISTLCTGAKYTDAHPMLSALMQLALSPILAVRWWVLEKRRNRGLRGLL